MFRQRESRASRRDTTMSPSALPRKKVRASYDVTARVVGDTGGVLAQRESSGQQQADTADDQQRRSGYACPRRS